MRAGYYRRRNDREVPSSYGQNWAQTVRYSERGSRSDAGIRPLTAPTHAQPTQSTPCGDCGGTTRTRLVNETLSFRDDLSIIKGAHAFKAGFEVLRFRLNSAVLANPVKFSFDGVTQGLQPERCHWSLRLATTSPRF